MKLFGKREKKNQERVLCWENITIKEWIAISNIMSVPDDDELDKSVGVLKVLTGKNYDVVPIGEFMAKVGELSFLRKPITECKCPDEIEINGRKYIVTKTPDAITTAQFLDYSTQIKTQSEDLLARVASVFLVPEGHEYGDGYSFVQVREDAMDMPFIVANSIAFFLYNQSKGLLKRFQRSLVWEILNLKTVKWKDKITFIRKLDTLSQTMESCLSYLRQSNL